MNDISGNEELNNEVSQVVLVNDSFDYSNHFENLENIGIFLIAIILGVGIATAFIKGISK